MSGTNQFSGKSTHAVIIASQDRERREQAALKLAFSHVCERGDREPCGVCRSCKLALSGSHPDIIFIDRPLADKGKPKKEIPVAVIRGMAADTWVRPHQADKKVYVIKEAGLMNPQAQNAALKTLEEPPPFAVFILCVGSAEELLPTIRSRCAVITVAGERTYEDDSFAREYLTLAGQNDVVALCRFFVQRESLDAAGLKEMLESIRRLLGDFLAGKNEGFGLTRRDAMRLLELCAQAEEYLRFNVGVKHVLGMLSALTERGNQFD